jgi:uncharacterized protein (DUF433 family)
MSPREFRAKAPEVCGGKACIDSTRIRVMDVVWLHIEGRTPEQVLAEYADLTLEQVYAALAYYCGHEEESRQTSSGSRKWPPDSIPGGPSSWLVGRGVGPVR